MYTQHFSHAPKIDQAPFMTQAIVSTQNGLGGYKKKDQELQQHLNKARDQDDQFIEGKLQDTENQFHTGWGSQQLPISVRMDRIRQGLSKVPKGHVHARLYRNRGVYSTNGQYIMEQGFGNNVNSLLQVMAMTGAQLKLEQDKSEKEKMKHKLIQEQLDKPVAEFNLSTVKDLDTLMNSQLLEAFDSSLVQLRLDARQYDNANPSPIASLLTGEQRKKFITFALDPAKNNDRRNFLEKSEQIKNQIHDTNTNEEAGIIKSEYQNLIQETFNVQAPLSQGLSGISDMITKQMTAIEQLSKPDNFTTAKFQSDYYLTDRHNSITTQERYAEINGQAAVNRTQFHTYNNDINNQLQLQDQVWEPEEYGQEQEEQNVEEISSFAPKAANYQTQIQEESKQEDEQQTYM